jgi:hypothetical protein
LPDICRRPLPKSGFEQAVSGFEQALSGFEQALSGFVQAPTP